MKKKVSAILILLISIISFSLVSKISLASDQLVEYENNVHYSDFEDRFLNPWTGGKYSSLSITNDSYHGDYALRATRIEGQSVTRFQSNFNVGVGENKIPEDTLVDFTLGIKTDVVASLDIMVQIDYVGGNKSITMANKYQTSTSYEMLEMKLSVKIENDTLYAEWQRPDMSTPTSLSQPIGVGSDFRTIHFIILSSDANIIYADDIKISYPVLISQEAALVVDLIEDIGVVNSNSLPSLEAAFSQYNNLSSEKKEEVFNYSLLVKKQREYYLLDGRVKGEFDDNDVVYRFGAISDSHNNTTENALQVLSAWDNKKMDALVHAGDITDRVQYDDNPREIPIVKAVFEDYLDEDVDIFFALGNHDNSDGSYAPLFYDTFGERFYRTDISDPEFTRLTGNRHSILGGHHFIAIDADYDKEIIPERTMDFLETTLESIVSDPNYNGEYIFLVSHVSAPNTVFNSSPIDTFVDLINDYPQVIMLTGHSHTTVYDERAIMQTDFTTVVVGSVSYTRIRGNFLESTGHSYTIDVSYDLSVGTMVEIDGGGNVKITRVDLVKNEEIGEPWILSKPKADNSHLLAYPKEREIMAKSPVWRENAKVEAKTLNEHSLEITFDTATDEDRVYTYTIDLYEKDASAPYKVIETLSQFYLYPQASDMPDQKTVILDDLDKLPYRVEVVANNVWGKSSEVSLNSLTKKLGNNLILPPSALEIDYDLQTYYLDSEYEVSLFENFSETLSNTGDINTHIGKSLYIRVKETDYIEAGPATKVDLSYFDLNVSESNNYQVNIENKKDQYFLNEEINFEVVINDKYKDNRFRVKVNGTIIEPNEDGVYSFRMYENTEILIEILDLYFTVLFPEVKGITFENLIGGTTVLGDSIFSFKINKEKGYDISKIVVKVNGEVIQLEEGVYNFKVRGDSNIEVTNVLIEDNYFKSLEFILISSISFIILATSLGFIVFFKKKKI
ncbi:MAG: metallophosphoesterase [Acholeplasmataceae bacterium]